MLEVRCGDCGRHVFDGTNIDEMGWLTQCGRRLSRIEAAGRVLGLRVCETIGGLKFDIDGALLSQKRVDR